ncbi:MAG: hypothetical protein LC768_00965 [Acidobacteria bacterium]|nr:hypothetical protein [Acidobacteriota bacterium]MCA1636905.1 hypothetical protein [Acidobacteriota bacterium]
MDTVSNLTPHNLFGVFELDSAGTVMYYGKRNDGNLLESKPNLIGRNFFEEAATFENVLDFQRRFKRFVSDSFSTDNFNFSFRSREDVTEAKVMLLHVRERDFDKSINLVIVDIRKA